jgi:hypothetical protein
MAPPRISARRDLRLQATVTEAEKAAVEAAAARAGETVSDYLRRLVFSEARNVARGNEATA